MNFLQLVQKAVRKSGAKIEVPSTVVAQTGLNALFVEWVSDAWKEIQLERLGLLWRRSRDLTLALIAGTDEYNIGGGLESVNTASLTCHLSNENESPVCFRTYAYWRQNVDRVDQTSGKPQYFTIGPDSTTFIFWPTPDVAYTVRYEGINVVEEMDFTDQAGAGTSDALTPTGLQSTYHDAIVWQAVMNYAMHFEDGSKLSEAQAKFKPYKKYFEERFMPIPQVYTSVLYDDYA